MKKIRYYIWCIRWLWQNRNWDTTRQKYKAMDKAWQQVRK